jgi:tRNA (guanine37-N1)-methyltransferase
MARTLAAGPTDLILVCGRYEGVDERVRAFVDAEVSLGDFVLTGGELVALCLIDAVARLLPGVLGNAGSTASESFEDGLLEYPQYTRPAVFRGVEVPSILQSGDHARIARWRRWQALRWTSLRRPDLFARVSLSDEDKRLLALAEDEL